MLQTTIDSYHFTYARKWHILADAPYSRQSFLASNQCFVKHGSMISEITGVIVCAQRVPVKVRQYNYPDSKDHGANMGPTWVLSAPRGLHVDPMNLAVRVRLRGKSGEVYMSTVMLCYMRFPTCCLYWYRAQATMEVDIITFGLTFDIGVKRLYAGHSSWWRIDVSDSKFPGSML